MVFCATFVSAEEPQTVTFVLASQPPKAISVQRRQQAEVSDKKASKFRVLSGIANSSYVSLEAVGAKDWFIRHANAIIYLHERPKKDGVFDADATWIMTRLPGEKVRFESSNYRGEFISVKEDGTLIRLRGAPPEASTFLLKP